MRVIIAVVCGVMAAAGCASAPPPAPGSAEAAARDGVFTRSETVAAAEEWLGVSAETVGAIVEDVFVDLGQPNGYIYGEEISGASGPGLRYGRGTLVTDAGSVREVYWQGPSVGWDVGGNASKTFTLVYDLERADDIYRRFPGVEGSAYLVGGVGVNYQRAEGITLAPMRAGVGARLGANVGYLAYSRDRRIFPF